MELTAAEVAAACVGHVVGPPATARGFAFDSRVLVPGEGFVALTADRDGHAFVADAFRRGAALALVEHAPADPAPGATYVVVADTADALLELGRAARDRLDPIDVVAITGSAGKTSTKDLTAAAVGAGRVVHAGAASFNNEIGLPVTLLATPSDTDCVVVEMGARFAGNIATLCAVARPRIGVITNIGLAHAEHLGGAEGIARTKGELLDALPADGLAVLNADCPAHVALRARTATPVLTVGESPSADVRIRAVQVDTDLHASFALDTPWGTADRVTVGLRGRHQAANAAQAATVALHLGVALDPVVAALGAVDSAGGRMHLAVSPSGVTVLDDAYNASPAAMTASLDAFGALLVEGRRVAVLGEMRELGAVSAAEHAKVGAHAAEVGVTTLVVVAGGTEQLVAAAEAAGLDVRVVADALEAAATVTELVRPGDAVLIKASRLVGLERVATALLEPVAGAPR